MAALFGKGYEFFFIDFNHIDRSHPIIVPNSRFISLVNHVFARELYFEKQVAKRIPSINTWQNFLADYFSKSNESIISNFDFSISQEQENAIWRSLVKDNTDSTWHSVEKIAREVSNAREVSILYGFGNNEAVGSVNDGIERCYELICHYEKRLQALGACDSLTILRDNCNFTSNGPASLAGFFYPSPLIRRWLGSFSSKRLKKEFQFKAKAKTHKFSRSEEEILTALTWAKELNKKSPENVIAICTDRGRGEVQRIKELAQDYIGQSVFASDFTSVLGHPFVSFVLLMLDLKTQSSWDKLSLLIMSNFIDGFEEEQFERIELDLHIRSWGFHEISLYTVRDYLKETSKCPKLFATLNLLIESNNQFDRKKNTSFTTWVILVQNRLKLLRWQNNRENIDPRYLHLWGQVFDSLCSLDAVLGSVTYEEFLLHLKSILRSQSVPHTIEGSSNIFIGDIDETLFINPTHLWLVNFSEESPRVRSDYTPLLPFDVQKSYGITGSIPVCDKERRLEILNFLISDRKEIHISFATEQNESTQSGSPLVVGLAGAKKEEYLEKSANKARFLLLKDDFGSPIRIGSSVKGGSSILADQALCPFRAYARFRLKSRPLQEPKPGFSASDQGLLVHKVMLNLWEKIKDKKTLVGLSEVRLTKLIEECLEAFWREWKTETQLDLKCKSIEHQRILKLVAQWLEVEKKSQDFTVVGLEKKKKIRIGGYIFHFQLDRIDMLENNMKRILDYKTGSFSPASWEAPRIESPQLLLYALSVGQDEQIQISVGKMSASNLRIYEKVVDTYVTKDSAWKNDLQKTVEEIGRGFAIINPKKGEATCRTCDQQPLCRINLS